MHLLRPASAAPRAEDSAVPGFGGGGSEVPRLCSGGGVFGGGGGSGSGLMANAGGRQNGPSMLWLLRWMAKGCVADSKPMIEHIGGAVTML